MNEINEFLKGMKEGEKLLGQMSKKNTISNCLALIEQSAKDLNTPEGQEIIRGFMKATRKVAKGYRKGMKKVMNTFLKTNTEFEAVAEKLSKYYETNMKETSMVYGAVHQCFVKLDI